MTSIIQANFRNFSDFDATTAPEAARAGLLAAERKFGRIPAPLKRYAAAPAFLAAAQQALVAFEHTSLTPIEREVVAMTISRQNGCHYCLALHEKILTHLEAAPLLRAALLEGTTLEDRKLETLRVFVIATLSTTGDVDAATWTHFIEAGFTHEQALEVILGIGAYTITTIANRLVEAPLE